LARLTPYELVFGADAFEETLFPGIRDEAEERASDAADPDRFVFLTSVGKLLRMIAGSAEAPARTAEGATGAGEVEEAGAAVREHAQLLFHAYNFWARGRQLFLLEAEALNGVLAEAEDAASDRGELQAPSGTGYLQLPRHRVWARVAEIGQPEAVDGAFWTLSGSGGAVRLDLLLVLGMRPDRAGFSVVPVGTVLEGGTAADWMKDARPGGNDFANTLPGGELEGLVSLETPAEALKLLASWFRYLERHPESLGTVERNPAEAAPASSHALPPSMLAYRRVRGVAPEAPGRGPGTETGQDAEGS